MSWDDRCFVIYDSEKEDNINKQKKIIYIWYEEGFSFSIYNSSVHTKLNKLSSFVFVALNINTI